MSKKLPVLIINSYAGSLTLAAHQERHPVVGSYEDAGYGLAIQRVNFPKLDYRETTATWPQRQDLSGTLVIAHPPCAAFSQQNTTKAARGLDAPKFQQTKAVIEYALRNRCAGLAVESVCGALEGARTVHNELAARYGYAVFRMLQNAVSFGVPQWRERFWAIFLPRSVGALRFDWVPRHVSLRDIYQEKGTLHEYDVVRFERQLKKVAEATDAKWARQLFCGRHGLGSIVRPLQRELTWRGRPAPAYRGHAAGSLCATSQAWCCSERKDSTTTFLCRVMRLVDPDGVAGAVLGDAWWVWPGMEARTFYEEEYKAVMGFPPDYDMSVVRSRLIRTYLSRGVCPPVARWVLRMLQSTVTGAKTTHYARREDDTVVDLRPTRREVKEALCKKVIAAY
jgi:site-specific DNA-cytosine methylase